MCKLEVRVDRILIHAPVGLVWDVLTRVERYDEWNPFTPQARTDFRIGSPAQLRVRMGPARMKITETVCAIRKAPADRLEQGVRDTLAAVRRARATPRAPGRRPLHVSQYGPADRCTGPAGLAGLRALHAPRLQRRGHGPETPRGIPVRTEPSRRHSRLGRLHSSRRYCRSNPSGSDQAGTARLVNSVGPCPRAGPVIDPGSEPS